MNCSRVVTFSPKASIADCSVPCAAETALEIAVAITLATGIFVAELPISPSASIDTPPSFMLPSPLATITLPDTALTVFALPLISTFKPVALDTRALPSAGSIIALAVITLPSLTLT